MNCGCEHGMKCTKVSACGVDDMINEAVYQAESKWEDKYWDFVAQVRELAEGMEHAPNCPAHKCVCGASKGYHGPLKPRGLILDHEFTRKPCTCPRGRLLAMCGVKE